VKIRLARTDEVQLLSAIALQAKAHWGYPAETLRLWEAQLIVTAEDVASKPTYVGEVENVVVGFYSLAMSGQTWELDNLWILPQFMHRGLGRALLNHALALAAQVGARSVTVDADPNAESFYLECGAIRYAAVSAPIQGQPERVRPQLRFELTVEQSVAFGYVVSLAGRSRID
jgi:GNAT superfamily N-acetyltransferase